MQNRMKTYTLVAPYSTVNNNGDRVQKGQTLEVDSKDYKELTRLGFTEKTIEDVEPEKLTKKKK